MAREFHARIRPDPVTRPSAGAQTRTADLDHDGTISGADLGLMLSAWGACP